MDLASSAPTEPERAAAAEQCEQLILRVWERRTAWPRGWPPPSAATVLRQLELGEADPYRPFRGSRPIDDSERTWTGTFPLIVDLQYDEREVWRDAALLEIDVTELQEWLDLQGDDLEPTERDTLERLLSAAESAKRRRERTIDPRPGSGSSEGVPDGPKSQLERLQKIRQELIERVTTDTPLR